MCLLDTVDGALMMALYTSTALANDRIAILYYSIVLTVVTVIIAIVIGVIQLLSLIQNVAEPTGKFWEGVAVAGDHYDVIGGAICGSFVVFGALSVVLYKPWRRWFDERRRIHHHQQQQPDQLEQGPSAAGPIAVDQHSHISENPDDAVQPSTATTPGERESST
ncbi:MAG: hypothetical protein LQ341_003111 [Variospora aurantia]|nr:MAG: hypothetical protein LQ341_003111 [Variospora aurantia]